MGHEAFASEPPANRSGSPEAAPFLPPPESRLLFQLRLKIPEFSQGRGQHPGLADECGYENGIQDLILARACAGCRSHVHLEALVRTGCGGSSHGQKLCRFGVQALGPQGIKVLEGGEDHELRAAGHDPQDEGHSAQHLLAVGVDILLQGFGLIQEGFDQGFVLGLHRRRYLRPHSCCFRFASLEPGKSE